MEKAQELAIFGETIPRSRASIFFLIFVCLINPFGSQLAGEQSQEGFISLDCGFTGSSSYQDAVTRVNYTGDAEYIDAGKIHTVSQNNLNRRYETLRSFPEGTRNCYRLSPVQPGNKYLVRAGFFYGNYDGQGSPPIFDLRLGVDFWTTVGIGSDGSFVAEIIAVSKKNNMQVCLVNTGGGTPFISLLELRPLRDFMYPSANASQTLVKKYKWNYGTRDQLRYPDDAYDRIWEGVADGFFLLNTTSEVQPKAEDAFQVPSKVIQTAITFNETNYHLSSVAVTGSPGERIYIVMHFAELVKLNPNNESRRLNIFGVDGRVMLFGNYSPPYLEQDHKEILNAALGAAGSYNLSIYVTESSTHSYMINALESFLVRPMNESHTDDRDVSAIEEIRRAFDLKRNWEADPCSPRAYTWEGVGCSYDRSSTARIILLNLSSSGLKGPIPSAIGNLTALRTLDLSGNNLTGPLPDNLADLSNLQSINLSGNEALGSIPRNLCNKLFTSGEARCKNPGTSHKKIIIALIVPAIIILVVVSFMCIILRKRKASSSTGATKEVNAWKGGSQFSYSEITKITQNFQHEIGKGGFGSVYLGKLNEETKVAVKVISSSSSQGSREFQAEIELLERVHHRNLVRLLGYCDEAERLSLVYEYMDNGTLIDHLSGKIGDGNLLSWNQRLSVALQAAQGLDYLHNGCRPPIVHRDIKSNNILLNSDFVAKISDFGLSRAFNNDYTTHITTGLAGTPGYLAPEYYEYEGRLDEKSDVYSFGIVLLEIITGQPPYQKSAEKTHIVKWVDSRVKTGDISNIVDPRLHGAFDISVAWKLVEVAISCTTKASQERLTMGDAVIELKRCVEMNKHGGTFEEPQSTSNISSSTYPLTSSTLSAPSAR